MQSVAVAGTQLLLLPSGAAYWEPARALFVADAHFGKALSFRKLGVPVPEATTGQTLAGLGAALAATGAHRIVFLGDFLHAARNQEAGLLDALRAWRRAHADVAMTLVRGNHDDRAGDPPPDLGIEVVDEPLALGPFALKHHPDPVPGAYVLAGHWHPCIRLHGRAHERLRLPCFWLGEGVGILPAFGAFTGMHPIERQPGDRVFAVAGEVVREVPARAGAAARAA